MENRLAMSGDVLEWRGQVKLGLPVAPKAGESKPILASLEGKSHARSAKGAKLKHFADSLHQCGLRARPGWENLNPSMVRNDNPFVRRSEFAECKSPKT